LHVIYLVKPPFSFVAKAKVTAKLLASDVSPFHTILMLNSAYVNWMTNPAVISKWPNIRSDCFYHIAQQYMYGSRHLKLHPLSAARQSPQLSW